MKERPTILVTGANGQLGKELQELAPLFPQFNFIFLSRADLPIHHVDLARNFFKEYHPHFLINCAAYTAVDKAEQEKDLAFQVNGEAVGVLAATCKEYQAKLIHISTDYVFDGAGSAPFKEDSPSNPQGVYGASKLEGEHQALQLNPDVIIIRTSWVYSEFGKNFVKTILQLVSERQEINVVNDQLGSPTYASDLAAVILQIISSGQWHPGIYHFSNEGVISWFDFAEQIVVQAKLPCKVSTQSSAELSRPAPRPPYSVLNTSKIRAALTLPAVSWESGLCEHLRLRNTLV